MIHDGKAVTQGHKPYGLGGTRSTGFVKRGALEVPREADVDRVRRLDLVPSSSS